MMVRVRKKKRLRVGKKEMNERKCIVKRERGYEDEMIRFVEGKDG